MNSVARRIASAFESAFRMAQPPMTSLLSENGPSVTVILPLASRTRAPSLLGSRPPVSTSVPSLSDRTTNEPGLDRHGQQVLLPGGRVVARKVLLIPAHVIRAQSMGGAADGVILTTENAQGSRGHHVGGHPLGRRSPVGRRRPRARR